MVELIEMVGREGRAAIEWRGRIFDVNRSEIRARFEMGDEMDGFVTAPWPDSAAGADIRAPVLRALNALVQRCGMFETCERAYQSVYGKRPAPEQPSP